MTDHYWQLDEPWQPFVYRAQVIDVIDGDTLDMRLDLGFNTYVERRVRLQDADAREIHFVAHDTDEYERGRVHTEFAADWVTTARTQAHESGSEWPFVVKTDYDQSGRFDRTLGRVYSRASETDLGSELLTSFDDVGVVE